MKKIWFILLIVCTTCTFCNKKQSIPKETITKKDISNANTFITNQANKKFKQYCFKKNIPYTNFKIVAMDYYHDYWTIKYQNTLDTDWEIKILEKTNGNIIGSYFLFKKYLVNPDGPRDDN